MRRTLVLFVFFAIVFALPVRWSVIETSTSESPPPARDPAFVYDKLNNRLLLFGGDAIFSIGIHDRTYAFDLNTNSWARINTSIAPPSRFSMIHGIDDLNQRLLVTIGQNYEGLHKDVWEFSLSDNTWREVQAKGIPPSARYGSSGGLFPLSNFMYVSHGFSHGRQRIDKPNYYVEDRMYDTHAFDVTTNTWYDVTPKCEDSILRDSCLPQKRCLPGGTPTNSNEFVMYGGCTSREGPCSLRSTWRFNGKWERLNDDTIPYFYKGPSARTLPTMVTVGTKVLLFGGRSPFGLTNEISVLINDKWQKVIVSENSPLPSVRNAAALVALNEDQIVMFGGNVDDPQLWLLSGVSSLDYEEYKYDSVIAGLFIFCIVWIFLMIFTSILLHEYSWKLRNWSFNYMATQPHRFKNLFSSFCNLSYFQFLFVICYIILTIAWLVLHYLIAVSENLGRATGHVSLLNFGALLIPVTKNSILTIVFGISYDRAIVFHRWLARWTMFFLAIHHIFMMVSFFKNIGDFSKFVNSPIWGFTAFYIFVLMSVLTLYRRRLFEVFSYSHKLAFIGLLFAIFHNYTLIYYLIPSLILYSIDFIIQSFRSFRGHSASLVAMDGITLLRIPKPFDYKAGQFIKICIPSISYTQWHPFSISSSPQNEYLECHIKSVGNWTENLSNLAKEKSSVCVYVNGPFGNPSIEIKKYSSLVLCAGGIGITPMASVFCYLKSLEKLVQNKVLLVWVVREEQEIIMLRDILGKVPQNKIFELDLYVTKSSADTSQMTEYQFGRPNFPAIFRNVAKEGPIGIMACGPDSMVTSIHESIEVVKSENSDMVIHLHKETFLL